MIFRSQNRRNRHRNQTRNHQQTPKPKSSSKLDPTSSTGCKNRTLRTFLVTPFAPFSEQPFSEIEKKHYPESRPYAANEHRWQPADATTNHQRRCHDELHHCSEHPQYGFKGSRHINSSWYQRPNRPHHPVQGRCILWRSAPRLLLPPRGDHFRARLSGFYSRLLHSQ